MSRYIDADIIRAEWLHGGKNEHIYDTNDFLDSIDYQPTADVEPVSTHTGLESNTMVMQMVIRYAINGNVRTAEMKSARKTLRNIVVIAAQRWMGKLNFVKMKTDKVVISISETVEVIR